MLYIYSITAAYMKAENKTRTFDPKKSIERAAATKSGYQKWKLLSGEKEYVWQSKMERVGIIREGIPYGTIEVISSRINVPIKRVLHIFDLPQTTYNKKKKEKSLLNGRDSEIVLLLTELIDFGIEVFNNEENKFQRWLKKTNVSLGDNTPESLLDSITGIQEVKNCLNRLEFGNLA
jgi:putative toxin-antitoxin system antitoxin component (TIGR02293 family)